MLLLRAGCDMCKCSAALPALRRSTIARKWLSCRTSMGHDRRLKSQEWSVVHAQPPQSISAMPCQVLPSRSMAYEGSGEAGSKSELTERTDAAHAHPLGHADGQYGVCAREAP